MTQQTAMIGPAPYPARFADTFVVFSVTVMSLAIGAWAVLQIKLALWEGMIASLLAYSILLSVHLMVRRNFVNFEDTLADFEEEGPWTRDELPLNAPPATRSSVDADAEADEPPTDEIVISRRPAAPAAAPPKASPGDLPLPRSADPFHYRPARNPSLPEPQPGGAPSLGDVVPGAAQPELSVEVIQDLIKKLADELNGTTPGDAAGAAKPTAAAPPAPPSLRAARAGVAPPTKAMPPPPVVSHRPYSPPSISPSRSPNAAPRTDHGAQAAPPPPPQDPQLARIAEAIAAERMEVLLEPIHALAEGRPRHFEVSMRLLTADGAALEQREFARVAQGSGLMPRIDAARMIRAARVARRLGERGRQGAVLTTVAGESLTDERFLDAAAAQPGRRPHGPRAVLRAERGAHLHAGACRGARHAGRRPASASRSRRSPTSTWTSARSKTMGFQFVKLDAPVFLEGLPAAGGARARLRHLPPPRRLRPDADRRPHRGRLAAGAHPRLRRAVRQRRRCSAARAGQGRGRGRPRPADRASPLSLA